MNAVVEEMDWHRTGDVQHVPQGRILSAEAKMDGLISYHEKAQTHMWVVVVTYQGTDTLLDKLDAPAADPTDPHTAPMLDADTLLMRPAIGCYICEEPYNPRMRRRRCPGHPKAGR